LIAYATTEDLPHREDSGMHQQFEDMQHTAIALISLMQALENNLMKADDGSVNENAEIDQCVEDWADALTMSPNAGRLELLSPAVLTYTKMKPHFDAMGVQADPWTVINTSTKVSPVTFKSDPSYPELHEQFIKDLIRMDYKINDEPLLGSRDQRVEQFNKALAKHGPDVVKVISQYANQTVLAEPLKTLMSTDNIGFHVTDQQGVHREQFDILDVTSERVLIRVSSQGQLRMLGTDMVDLATSPIGYHFDLDIKRVEEGQWKIKTSNISGAYRALK
jgi:hypothetical protein